MQEFDLSIILLSLDIFLPSHPHPKESLGLYDTAIFFFFIMVHVYLIRHDSFLSLFSIFFVG
ncbi:hypothetical protein LguiA_012164 [Lonicera macranthoides]